MSDPRYVNVGSPAIRLLEELSELQQAVCKAERFGWFNHHPDRPGDTNMDDVKREIDDVANALEHMEEHMRQLKHQHYSEATQP